MGRIDTGLYVAAPRIEPTIDGSACAHGLCDEVDLPTAPRDVST
jgi:hypothetical protein